MCTGLVVVVVVVVFSITVLFYIYFLLCLSSLSVCAILLTVFDFSTYVVNKHLISPTCTDWRKATASFTPKISLPLFNCMPTMECCCVDDMSPECAVTGLSPGLVDPDVD